MGRSGKRISQDIGYDILPEISGAFTDLPMKILMLLIIGTAVFCSTKYCLSTVHSINIIRRYTFVLAIGTLLRFVTFISTTIPGSASYCLLSNTHIDTDKPHTIYDIFSTVTIDEEDATGPGTYNCGDLTFSGHQLNTIVAALCCIRYMPQVFSPVQKYYSMFNLAIWTLVAWQVSTSVACENFIVHS
jgi:hypothetical protein